MSFIENRIIFLCATVGTTYYFFNSALTDLAKTWLGTRLSEAVKIAHEQNNMLNKYDLNGIPASISKAKMDAAGSISRIEVGQQGCFFAVDSKGIVAMHPEKERIGMDVSTKSWFLKMRPGKGWLDNIELDGKRLAMYAYFEPWEWYILATDPQEEVYAIAGQMKPYLILLGITGFAGMAVILMLMTQRLTKPIVALAQGADRIGKGDLETRIPITTSDEFGLLAEVFNQMAEDLNKTLAAIQFKEEYFRSLIENASDVIVVLDADGKLIYTSPSTKRMLGYSEKDLIGKNAFDFIHPDDRDRNVQRFNRQISSRAHLEYVEYRIQCKNGSWTTLEGVGRNLLKHPAVKGFVLNGRDVTKRKETENAVLKSHQELEQRVAERTGELMQTNQRLRQEIEERKQMSKEKDKLQVQLLKAQKMEAIGTLAGGIAHDFNNLLMGIQGNVSILLLKMDAHPALKERLGIIEDFIHSGSNLTQQLLGFARLGKYEVTLTNINDLINKSTNMFCRTRKELQVRLTLEKNIRSVMVDRGQIQQVLLNLFINAWQAMPEGGDLSIQTSNLKISDKDVPGHEMVPGTYVQISVSDTGIGMDQEVMERIFDPFFTTKEMRRGTGLGLASVYGIVKNHGGFIDVNSQKGVGTTFNIYLEGFDEKIDRVEVDEQHPLKGDEMLLFIDDELMIVEVADKMLSELGYGVMVASSGREALEIYRQRHGEIDLVILDMVMPDMGGGKVYEGLKQINPNVKVLLSSGYSVNGQAKKILEKGCNGFIQKPFDLLSLSREIRYILESESPLEPALKN